MNDSMILIDFMAVALYYEYFCFVSFIIL